MIIPNKHSGYQAGIRLYPMGGGGGGPSQPGMGDSQVGNTGGTTGVGTGISIPPPPAWSNMAVNTEQGYNTLQSMRGVPWEKSGTAYNELLNQGFTSNQIRDSASQMYGKPSDSNWSGMVQNAGMTSPTGRPMAGSDQFYQPIYQSQYQNYNMGNPMSVSQYGQQPQMNWQTGQMMQPAQPAQQAPFNPYTNSFGGGFGGFGGFGGYGGGFGGGFGGFGGGFDSGYGGFMPQMQSPYSYQQPMQQAQPAQQSPLSSIGRAIVGRSSQARGTPNVMRRAEGGIASLMDDE